jgi:nitrite reductase/ring-hydroxylating ferredoxin subunit/uncharacterized membrane protein
MTTTGAREPRGHAVIEGLEHVEALDPPAEAIAKQIRNAIPRGAVKDALSGSWLGHALHPLLTDVTIGTWLSALLLDWTGGSAAEPAADRLLAIGLSATLPVAATGASDWADTTVSSPAVRRVGLVHAAANVTAASLMAASLAARGQGARGRGKALALAGGAVVAASGYLGGHLSFARGVGVDQTAFETPPEEWTDVLAEGDLAAGEPRCVEVGGVPVLVVRDGADVHALSDRCAHRGGPLHEGEIADGCVTCPWHGSTFRLSDGSLEQGPSAYPQPAWETRVEGGRVAVRPSR